MKIFVSITVRVIDSFSIAFLRYTKGMKLTQVIFAIAIIIVIVWILGALLKLAAWLISGLFYVAAIIVIIGIILAFINSKRTQR